MFISTAGPRGVWHGPNALAAALEERNNYLLYRRFAEMSTNASNGWGGVGLKAEPLVSDDPWYQQASDARDEDFLVSRPLSRPVGSDGS